MAENFTIRQTVDLSGINPNWNAVRHDALMYPGDNLAHTWEVQVKRNGIPVDMTGGNVVGYFQRKDGNTVMVDGTIEDSICKVTMAQECYAIPGALKAVMRYTDTVTHTIVTLAYHAFTVQNRIDDGGIIDPGEVIPSIDDLLAEIEAMEQATAAAEVAANKSVRYDSAQTLTDAQKEQARGNIDAASEGEVTDLKSQINEMVIYPENTIFADKIASDPQLLAFEDALPNIKKYEGLVYYNGKLIASSADDSYCFFTPYDNFTFAIFLRSSDAAYSVPSVPEGVVNENINATQLSGTVLSNEYTQFTIPLRNTIVFFRHGRIYTNDVISNAANHFSMRGLELDAMQDNFLRYSVQGADSAIIPFTVTKAAGKLVQTSNGSLSTSASYDTYYFKVPVSQMQVTCTNGFRCVTTTKDPTLIDSNKYLKRVIYSATSGRVDTFTAYLGEYVIISLANATNPTIDLKTDLVKSFTLPTLRLDYGQKQGFYRLYKTTTAKYLYIYYVSGSKLVGWELHNVPTTTTNSNTWQIGHVMGYDFDGRQVSNGVELVSGGEFELAFKEYGAADYCGGNNHGDENTIDFTLMIDGKTIDFDSIDSDYHVFDRIDAIEHAYVNRCDTTAENILKHQKIWTFENGTVKVRQTLEFLETLKCDFLCCMLAANRSAFTHGVRQGRVGVEDMSTSTYDRVRTDSNEMMYLMYGTNCTAKVTAKLDDHTPAGSLWINNASTLNKLYYNYFGQMPRTSVESGTILKWESEYDIAYN